MARIIPVILCGGAGRRLWPLSTAARPKQFLKLPGSACNLLQETALRLRECTPESPMMAVTGARFAARVRQDLAAADPALAAHVITEDAPRNTAPAIALALLYAHAVFGADSLLWICPSDHAISESARLQAALPEAIRSAQAGNIVTFGIRPERPETGYGYIECPASGSGAFKIQAFHEKPDLATAKSYLSGGQHFWNSGMFVFSVATGMKAFEDYALDVLRPVASGRHAKAPSISFDKAIMEKAANTTMIACDPGWTDIGTWKRLAREVLRRRSA